MASTELHVVFRVRGTHYDPDRITALTGVWPTRAFRVGDATGRSARTAGWEWQTETASDDVPLIASVVAELGPHAHVFRAARDDGATVSLTVVGEVRGDLVPTAAEAERRQILAEENEEFVPILDVDRVGVSLNGEAIQFLAAAGARYSTHIDCEYEPLLRDS